MTEPTPLSPAAQAVLRAGIDELDYVPERHVSWCVAAALRAFGDQVLPPPGSRPARSQCWLLLEQIREELLGIATELEGAG